MDLRPACGILDKHLNGAPGRIPRHVFRGPAKAALSSVAIRATEVALLRDREGEGVKWRRGERRIIDKRVHVQPEGAHYLFDRVVSTSRCGVERVDYVPIHVEDATSVDGKELAVIAAPLPVRVT
jgi:hypothetical protein